MWNWTFISCLSRKGDKLEFETWPPSLPTYMQRRGAAQMKHNVGLMGLYTKPLRK